jgi:hypothetical protein
MRYFRIYADADGESHFEDLDVALRPSPGGSELSALYPASGVIFRRSPPLLACILRPTLVASVGHNSAPPRRSPRG